MAVKRQLSTSSSVHVRTMLATGLVKSVNECVSAANEYLNIVNCVHGLLLQPNTLFNNFSCHICEKVFNILVESHFQSSPRIGIAS